MSILRRIFRRCYYLVYGTSGRNIKINNEDYTVSAHVSRGINSVIDEVPLKLLINLCTNADTLFDIGGNIGVIATILAKKMKPGSVIYSFEPAPLSFKYLSDTARVQKGNARIVPVNYAVSNNNNKLYFTNDGNSCTNHISSEKEAGTISVDSITIDAFCQDKGVIPQVLKIDIEGAEYWALEGLQKTLKNNDCTVLVEIHHGYLESNNINGKMFEKLIGSAGYKVFNASGNEIRGEQIMNNSCVILSKKTLPENIFRIG